MDLLFEILFEVYGELMLLIVPEEKMTKKYRITVKLIAIFVLLSVIALAVWGIVLIFDFQNLVGIVPLSVAVLISLAQITAGIVLYGRHH